VREGCHSQREEELLRGDTARVWVEPCCGLPAIAATISISRRPHEKKGIRVRDERIVARNHRLGTRQRKGRGSSEECQHVLTEILSYGRGAMTCCTGENFNGPCSRFHSHRGHSSQEGPNRSLARRSGSLRCHPHGPSLRSHPASPIYLPPSAFQRCGDPAASGTTDGGGLAALASVLTRGPARGAPFLTKSVLISTF
jgi:hypothetical protein